jgi:ABC-type branched-subunit amino acid transport system substrate-binding protein
MKKYIWVAIIVILVVVVGLLISQEKADTIKIGVTEALTGNYASIGNDITRGIKDAFSEIDAPKLLGSKVELEVSDNVADPKKAVSDYQLFKTQNIKIVMSAFSGVVNALNPLSKQDHVILMQNVATPQFAHDNEYAFKVYSDTTKEAALILQYINTKKLTNIGIAHVDNPTTVLLMDQFSKGLTNFKQYSFGPSDTDFRTTITKIKADGVKNLILLGYSAQDLSFVKQAAELQFNPGFIFTTSDGSVAELVNNIEGFVSSSTKYVTAAYGTNDLNYLFGYDLAKTLIMGMQSCKDLGQKVDDPECLKVELEKVGFEGKSGNIRMTENRVADVAPSLMTIKDKQLLIY